MASEKAPNSKYEGDVINKWDFGENNPNLIVYQCEDSSNVGCVVTFKPKSDTVLVRSYKGQPNVQNFEKGEIFLK